MALLRTPRRLRRRRRAAPLAASRRILDRMRMVLDVSRPFAVADLETLLHRVAETAASLLGAERGLVFLHDERTGELRTHRPAGAEERVRADGAFLRAALSSERAVRYRAEEHGPLDEPVRGALAAPLRDIDLSPLGVLVVADKARGDFSDEDAVLAELIAEQASLGLQRFRYRRAAVQAAELRREMEIARAVQASLAPAQPPRLADVEAAGWSRAASVTGGDAYDVWSLPGDCLGLLLGDASGHGLPAALVIAQVRTLVRSLSEIQAEPEWLLQRVNARLAQDLTEGRFVTAFVAVVSTGGLVRWSSAGQGPVFVCRSPGSGFDVLQAPAVPLGVAHELAAGPAPALELEPGGLLVVASDGVLEARDPAQEMLGPARMLQALEECRGLDARDLVSAVRARLEQWQHGQDPADDQTLLVVRRTR